MYNIGMDTQGIGKNIQRLRQSSGMTQKQLAEKLSVTDKAVSKWENGYGLPDITIMPQIAAVFGTTIDELYLVGAHEKDEEADMTDEKTATGGKLHLTQITLNQFSLTQVITYLATIVLMLFNSSISVYASGANNSLSFIPAFGHTLMGLNAYAHYPSSGLAQAVYAACPVIAVLMICLCVYLIVKTLFPDTKNSMLPHILFAAAVLGILLLSLLVCFILNKQYGNNYFFIPVTYYIVSGLAAVQLIMEYSVYNYSAAMRRKSIFTLAVVFAAAVMIGGTAIAHNFSYESQAYFFAPEKFESTQTVHVLSYDAPDPSGGMSSRLDYFNIGYIILDGNITPKSIKVITVHLDGAQIASRLEDDNNSYYVQSYKYRTSSGYATLVQINSLTGEQPVSTDSVIVVRLKLFSDTRVYTVTLHVGEILKNKTNEDGNTISHARLSTKPFEQQLDITRVLAYR